MNATGKFPLFALLSYKKPCHSSIYMKIDPNKLKAITIYFAALLGIGNCGHVPCCIPITHNYERNSVIVRHNCNISIRKYAKSKKLLLVLWPTKYQNEQICYWNLDNLSGKKREKSRRAIQLVCDFILLIQMQVSSLAECRAENVFKLSSAVF